MRWISVIGSSTYPQRAANSRTSRASQPRGLASFCVLFMIFFQPSGWLHFAFGSYLRSRRVSRWTWQRRHSSSRTLSRQSGQKQWRFLAASSWISSALTSRRSWRTDSLCSGASNPWIRLPTRSESRTRPCSQPLPAGESVVVAG